MYYHDKRLQYPVQVSEPDPAFAAMLQQAGVTSGDHVPIVFAKSKWAIVSMLGVLLAGGSCVMIDIKQGRRRMQHMFSTVQARLIVCDSDHAVVGHAAGLQTVTIDAHSVSTDLIFKEPQMRVRSHV